MPSEHDRPFECLLVEVGGRRFGLPASDVQEVVPAVTVTPLGQALGVIEGVINYRGALVPVLEARRHFGRPTRPVEHTDHFVVLRAAGHLLALRVDRATELRTLNRVVIEEVSQSVRGTDSVSRIAKLPEALVLIHEPAAFLSRREFETVDHVLAASAPATSDEPS